MTYPVNKSTPKGLTAVQQVARPRGKGIDPLFVLPPVDTQSGEADLPTDVAQRIRMIANGEHSAGYQKEFVLQALQQMLFARVPVDQIAKRFKVTTRTVLRWRRSLYQVLTAQAKSIDPYSFIGNELAHIDQLRAVGWQQIMTAKNATERKMGHDMASSSGKDAIRLMQLAGMFDNVSVGKVDVNSDPSKKSANDLADMARDFLQGRLSTKPGRNDTPLTDDQLDSNPLDETIDVDSQEGDADAFAPRL